MEIWKKVDGYEEYEISSIGRVRKNGNIAKCGIDRINGYAKCGIYVDGKTITKQFTEWLQRRLLKIHKTNHRCII